MTVLTTDTTSNMLNTDIFFDTYPWFYSNLYQELIKSTNTFFQKDFNIRFMGISNNDNILFYGDEYFVNKIPVSKTANFIMKLSSGVIEHLLDTTLGSAENAFKLKNLTNIEAMLIKSYTVFFFKNIENKLNKIEANKKILQQSKNFNFTFYLKEGKKHLGKIIITLPDYILPELKTEVRKETYTINDFKKTCVNLRLRLGKSKIALTDIKALEDGDILVLEESDINKMAIMLNEKEISFKVNPNPSLIISIDNNGGNEMEEETSIKPQNMWDSILVDIVAEFDNVKLTLGELKQISEGLVIDVGSVYDNKINLRVENQIVATGELVILNDRYGVRIDNVKKSKETPQSQKPQAANAKTPERLKEAAAPAQKKARTAPPPPPAQKQNAEPKQQQAAPENENFDYSDFEIEDESI